MLTPTFSLHQNADYLFIQLHVPYIKTENAECDANGDEFYFSAKPYYLRLHLPGNVVNDDRLKSEYNVDKGDLNIRVPKEMPGQKFDGLDMLTKLLTPKQSLATPNIEVLETRNVNDCDKHSGISSEETSELDKVNDDAPGYATEEFDFDWFIEQKVSEDEKIQVNKAHYGFANQKFAAIGGVCSEIDAIDLKDPDNVSAAERTLLREKQEEDEFDCEHYLVDLFDEDELIHVIIASEFPILTGVCSTSNEEFTDFEKERLMKLPRREYLIDHDTTARVCLGLVDLVYAYSYNYRFCGGENNIESDWTICKLSATLSWFDSFHNLRNVVVSCARRTLCFPLHRSWKLFDKVFSDVKQIFKAGKHQILKCLLGIHSVLEKSESQYLLNDLYITDYCVWIQSVDSHVINSLALSLSKLEISKADVGLSIAEIDADTEKLMSEYPSDDEGVDELSKKMVNVVHITNVDDVDSDDENDVEDDDSDDEDDDSASDDENDVEDDEDEDTDTNVEEEENEHECQNEVVEGVSGLSSFDKSEELGKDDPIIDSNSNERTKI